MLTISAVQNAKGGLSVHPVTKKPIDPVKPYKMAEERGLFLLVTAAGGKLWRWKYRRPATKKENLLSLGSFPDVSLKRARQKRDEARTLLADGIDPSAKRKAEGRASADTFARSRANGWSRHRTHARRKRTG